MMVNVSELAIISLYATHYPKQVVLASLYCEMVIVYNIQVAS
jgi:hypothetical protein